MEDPRAATDGRVRRGDETRRTVLRRAVDVASVGGLDGVTIGRLAQELSISKSGLFAHFGSKEELQLATIDTANSIFDELVLEPAANAAPGIDRLRALLDAYLRYVESGTFPGGCFFATVLVEVSMQPGAVRDRLATFMEDWLGRLESTIRDAQQEGDIDKAENPAQLAFELESSLFLANSQFAVVQSHEPIERGRRAIERRLAEAAA